jgi:hypothetical protein
MAEDHSTIGGMMGKTNLYGTLALTLLVGAVACDRPDTIDGAAMGSEEQALVPQAMDPQVIAQIMEIQEIQQVLEPLQREALQDEGLAGRLAALQVQVETAMREADAEIFERIDRFQDDLAAAEAAGDQEGMQSLMVQAQELQQHVQALQADVLDRPEIRDPVAEFESAQRARMIEIDPEAEALLDRVDELMASLPQ